MLDIYNIGFLLLIILVVLIIILIVYVGVEMGQEDDEIFSFPSIYIINLERKEERYNYVSKQLDKLGIIEYERWNAIDGFNTDDNVFMENGITNKLMERRGLAGCALSHIKLWEHIKNNKMGWTLILEDDVHFHPQFKNLLPKYWKDVPKDAKIVFLGYCGDLEKKNQKIIKAPVMCTHGYMISWEGAKILLDNLIPMKDPVDIEIMNYFLKNNSDGCYVLNGDIFIDGIRPNEYKEKNGNKCMFNGIIYQNQEEQGSTIHQIDTVYEYR